MQLVAVPKSLPSKIIGNPKQMLDVYSRVMLKKLKICGEVTSQQPASLTQKHCTANTKQNLLQHDVHDTIIASVIRTFRDTKNIQKLRKLGDYIFTPSEASVSESACGYTFQGIVIICHFLNPHVPVSTIVSKQTTGMCKEFPNAIQVFMAPIQ